MNCNKCGSELVEGSKFCPNCGTPTHGNSKKQKSISLLKILVIIIILIAVIVVATIMVLKNKNNNSTKNETVNSNVEEKEDNKKELTDESEIRDYIMKIIDENNNTEYWEYEPTEEEMDAIVEFYKSDKDNFDSETLWVFLIEQGFVGRGWEYDVDYEEETSTNNGMYNAGNTENTQRIASTNNSNNDKEEETDNVDDKYKFEVEIKLNIHLKELIEKNEVAKEIMERYPTIYIHVWVEDTSGGKDLYEYYGGGESLPDIITADRTLHEGTGYFMGVQKLDTFKDRNEKRKIEIVMDNAATAIVRTTLFEGEMAFPESGTYEIR